MPDAVSVVDAGWKDAQQVVVLAATAAVPAHIFAWQVSVGGATTLAVADPVPPVSPSASRWASTSSICSSGPGSGKSYARWFGGWRVIDNLHDPDVAGLTPARRAGRPQAARRRCVVHSRRGVG